MVAKSWIKRYLKVCPVCGKEFRAYKHAIYCSSKCQARNCYQKNKESIKKRRRQKGLTKPKICLSCKKEFLSNKPFQRRCIECTSKAFYQIKICEGCNKEYFPMSGFQRYCSFCRKEIEKEVHKGYWKKRNIEKKEEESKRKRIWFRKNKKQVLAKQKKYLSFLKEIYPEKYRKHQKRDLEQARRRRQEKKIRNWFNLSRKSNQRKNKGIIKI